jgi:formylglycine-generating enzyme required for sulfatase activity
VGCGQRSAVWRSVGFGAGRGGGTTAVFISGGDGRATGEFMMGSPLDERNRKQVEGVPRHVVIARRIAIGRFEITVDQFSAFVTETGMTVGNTCKVIVEFDGSSAVFGRPEASFRHPGFDTTGSHPVVCVSWHEAQAYTAWLRRRTGKQYRLPTEAEWEYAARADTQTSYSFGNDETELCTSARFADLGSRFGWRGGCRSDVATYGPISVGKLRPNPWGIFDMHGNAWEWVDRRPRRRGPRPTTCSTLARRRRCRPPARTRIKSAPLPCSRGQHNYRYARLAAHRAGQRPQGSVRDALACAAGAVARLVADCATDRLAVYRPRCSRYRRATSTAHAMRRPTWPRSKAVMTPVGPGGGLLGYCGHGPVVSAANRVLCPPATITAIFVVRPPRDLPMA